MIGTSERRYFMHRNDLDRHVDNMESYRKIEIMSDDNRRTKVDRNPAAKLIAFLLIAFVVYILVRISK